MLKPMQKFALVSRIVMILFIGGSLFMSYIGLTQVTENVFAASTITVNSTADNLTAGDGNCTLREAMTNSNADSDSTSGDCTAGSGDDTIAFNIAPLDGSVKTISPSSALPNIVDTVTIDGSTQDNADCSTHTIKIEIDYSGYLGLAMGLVVVGGPGATGTTIKGLAIVNATQHGIWANSANTTIACNNIGVKADGTTAGGMDGVGVLLYPGTTGSVVGGASVSDRNVISANTGSNIAIHDDSVTISGNYVGTDATGNTALVGGNNGIAIYSSNNIIGGSTSAERNVISGNGWTGIGVADAGSGGPSGNTIKGNYIGLGADGTTDLGNNGVGVWLVDGANSNTIGGDSASERNVISGNSGHGVHIEGGSTLSNTVSGNYIGTNAAGTSDLGNNDAGVLLDNSSGNTVGGTTSGERNVISGNATDGIWLYGDSADNNVMQGNYIGTNAAGTGNIGNANNGINISFSADSNLVGGTVAGASNLIRYNGSSGVIVPNSGSLNNAIIGNSIYQNSIPDINLGVDGATANDANDADSGPNDLLNHPEWATVAENAGNTDVTYSLDVPSGNYRIEFFSRNGKTLLESQNVTHTGSGVENFINTLSGTGLRALRMTATEIDGGLSSGFGATSEYSDAYVALNGGTATLTVNSIADDEDNDGECTLREAITASNDDIESGDEDGECVAGAATDTIEFSIAGSGVHTIQPDDALPAIEDSGLTINGYSQTGAVENSGDYSTCFEGTIKIEIDGSNAANDDDGLVINADNVTVRGLAINRFPGSGGEGILIASGSGSTVAGNILGLDTDGLVDRGNGGHGVYVNSAAGDVTIGGSNVADRNLVSGNNGFGGISISSDSGTNTIIGNCIGTNATGSSAVANAHEGINFYQSSATNRVGGTTAGERNIISGNTQQGIYINDSSVESIRGNYIGTDVTGSADLGNGSDGIGSNADSTLGNIGGTSSGARNVISGNEGSGIYVLSASTIQGNYIGLDATGSVGLGNTSSGIKASGAGTVVGGASPGAGNVVSDNGDGGILADAAGDIVQGNLVGTSADGLSPLGNVSYGIEAAENDVIVGGDTVAERNVVAASITGGNFSGSGIVVISFGSGSTGAIIQGNYVGTNINGAIGGGFGNAGWGVFVIGDYKEALIGGTGSGEGNKIVSSGFDGICVYSFIPFNFLTTDNTIIGNSIYQNGSTGIRLMADTDGNFAPDTPSPFPNDDGLGEDDADIGPNDFLNHPVLNSSSATSGSLDVNFDLDVPDINPGVTGYRVEFFANDAGDASGNGEGQIYLGHADVSGDVTNHSETISLDPGVITTGTYDISATVTEIDGSTNGFSGTSEFSNFLDNKSVIQPVDNDGDGVNDAVEDAGPNGGDGNDDGTIDSEQIDVATILDESGDNYLTLALEDGGACDAIADFESTSETDQATLDPNYDYPYGMNSFTIPCADSVDALLYYHGHTYDELLPSTPRKFGPTTPGDSSTNAWYSKFGLVGGFEVNGVPTAVMEIALTDGAQGDDTANDNVIVDDNGLGVPVENSGAIGNIISALASTGFNERLVIAGGAILFGIGSFLMINKRLRAGK